MKQSSKTNQKKFTSVQREYEVAKKLPACSFTTEFKTERKQEKHQGFVVDWQIGNVNDSSNKDSNFFR